LRKENVSYKELEQEMIKEISKLGAEGIAQRGVLSTSDNNHVTSRRMRFIPDGLKLYGWTTLHSRKHRQIQANPNVSVCVGFVQIDGKASMKKHPMDEPEFLALYKAKLPEAYENSIGGWREADQAVIEVVPERIALYHIMGRADVSYLDVLYVDRGEAYRFYELNEIDETEEDTLLYWGEN
jgi:general stress protein 26